MSRIAHLECFGMLDWLRNYFGSQESLAGKKMMTPHALTIPLPLILLSALSTHAFGQTDKPMTNQDVIKLVKLGLSSEIIIKKNEDSPPAYDLSIDGLTLLAQSRVPNDVIKAMQAAATREEQKASRVFQPTYVVPSQMSKGILNFKHCGGQPSGFCRGVVIQAE